MTPITRRGMLAFGASSLAGLAGCQGQGGTRTDPGSESLFEDISFDDTDMVVQLRENHDVDRVNLISPDGSLFTSAGVPVGVTTIRLEILDIEQGRPTHYTPGLNVLIGVQGEQEKARKEVLLNPMLRITEIRPFIAEDLRYAGYLGFRIENSGTAPTWIYDVTFQNAPNHRSNQGLTDYLGIPQVGGLENKEDVVLRPGESRLVTSVTRPISYSSNSDRAVCDFHEEFTVRVGVASGEVLSERVRVRVRGDPEYVSLMDDFTCTEIDAELISTTGENP